MKYLDARRLTGPNLLWNKPGSILDVECEPHEADDIVQRWSALLSEVLSALEWTDSELCTRKLEGGVSLAFSAPIDVLYAATEINEYVWALLVGEDAEGNPPPGIDDAVAQLRRAIEEECNPALLNLASAAAERGAAFLWDDDDVSVGHGSRALVFPFRELPEPSALDWSDRERVPTGIVTGTNGKTTTVRLATHIARTAGRSVGVSCTDWIAVNDEIIDRGDWSGPGGARNVLRADGVDLAILETARGGLLRRGLGVDEADAALITNIAEDHLGDFGSRNLRELLDIKWVVSRAVEKAGTLILNADDHRLVEKAANYPGTLIWFSLEPDSTVVQSHVRAGGTAFVLDNRTLTRLSVGMREPICEADDIPVTLKGAARHNTANALAAAALTATLGVSLEDVARGLQAGTQQINPGRCNVYDANGVQLLVDFAHNPAAMQALFDMAEALPAKRRVLAFGQAGDRPDGLIRDLARSAWGIGLDAVVVSELAEYHRGREHGDVFRLIRDELVANGANAEQIFHHEEEIESLDFALGWARPGDLVILLDLGRSDAVQERLSALQAI